jgi:hypothetical protein
MSFAYQAAHRFGDAQAPFSMNGEGHGSYYTSQLRLARVVEWRVWLVSESPTQQKALIR